MIQRVEKDAGRGKGAREEIRVDERKEEGGREEYYVERRGALRKTERRAREWVGMAADEDY